MSGIDQYPFIDVFGGSGRGRQSQIVVPGASTRDNFEIGAQLSFELDVWRRLSRATEASIADLLATEATYRTLTIGLGKGPGSGRIRLDLARPGREGSRSFLRRREGRGEKPNACGCRHNQAATV